MDLDLSNYNQDQLKQLRQQLNSKLKGTSKYQCKGVYRQKKNKLRFFSPNEWILFTNALPSNLKFLYWFYLLTGLRFKEGKYVHIRNFYFKDRRFEVLTAKGDHARWSQLSSYATKFIKSYIELQGLKREDKFKFPSNQHAINVIKQTCRKIGFDDWKDFSIHNIRKTHENYLYSLSLQSQVIGKHLGHNSKTSYNNYLSSATVKNPSEVKLIKIWLGDIFG